MSAKVVGIIGLSVLCVPVLGAVAYLDGPPPAHTGGFDEPTCNTCHFDGPVDDPEGTLALEGVPGAYTPGQRYLLTITLSRPEMRRGGFQVAARFADGERAGDQAGSLEATDDRAEVTESGGVQYLHHTPDGAALPTPDTACWTIEWTPPPDGASGSVVFHVAANAANGDDSEFGDFIYTRHQTSKANPDGQ